MTERIVRIEKRFEEGERYPSEIAFTKTDEGTWTIPDNHLGRWTGRAPDVPCPPEHPRSESSECLTRDDLHVTVVATALRQGRPLPDAAEALMTMYEERAGELSPAASVAAAELAAGALAWLNGAKAPAERRFVLEDALYLIEGPVSVK